MENESAKDKLVGIIRSDSQAIAKVSASQMGRGLRHLSGWDAARVLDVGKELTSVCDKYQVDKILTAKLKAFLNPRAWTLLWMNEKQDRLDEEMSQGFCSSGDIHALLFLSGIAVGHGVAGKVAETNESVVVGNVQHYIDGNGQLDGFVEKDANSIVAVPLHFGEKCVGVLELFDCVGPDGFPQADLALLESLADFAAIALENIKRVCRIQTLTITDELTGLYKSHHLDFVLDTEIYRSGRYGYEFSLIFANGLEELASSLSHIAFNRLLAEIGLKIKAGLRRIDWAFYNPEEEFAVILPHASKDIACAMADRLRRIIEDTLGLARNKENLRLTAKTGVAIYPTDARTKIELIQRAKVAMNPKI
jgi:diguanylate cyclase (GGDEF)-like protein